MEDGRDVAVIVGSLRKESYSRKLARELIRLAPGGLRAEIVEIGQLQLYNQDFDDEGRVPAEWQAFRDRVRRADGVLFVTPEYNRSIPGVLKNAIDVGSRPKAQNAWREKPAAIVSVSPGVLGAFGANHELRQALVFPDVLVMAQPEAYIGGAAQLFDEHGHITKPATEEFLGGVMRSFARWIERVA